MAILLIEDAPQIAKILIAKLTMEGYEVIWKRDGDSALEHILETSVQLVLLSTDLGKKNAWDVLRKLTSNHPNIPVLMLLEQEEAEEEIRAKQEGSKGCIIKPFKPTVVAKTIKTILGTDERMVVQ